LSGDCFAPGEELEGAREKIEKWLRDYNEERLHSSLGNATIDLLIQ
jgi:transposase InsO family protein